jgi:hypothetical protein
VLEALSEFHKKKEAATLAALMSAKTPEEAFAIACEYKGLLAFVREADANVKAGDYALRQIEEEETD